MKSAGLAAARARTNVVTSGKGDSGETAPQSTLEGEQGKRKGVGETGEPGDLAATLLTKILLYITIRLYNTKVMDGRHADQ